MNREEYSKIQKSNIEQLNKLMDLRIRQLKELSPEHWWEESINDPLYKFLCQQLVNIKATNIYPTMEITEEQIKQLASKAISPEEFLELIPNQE